MHTNFAENSLCRRLVFLNASTTFRGNTSPLFAWRLNLWIFLKNQHTMKDGFRTIVAGAGAYKLGGG